MRFSGATLSLYLRVRLRLDGAPPWRCEAPLERREPPAQLLEALAVGRAQLADRLGEPGGRLLPAPRDLVAGDLAAADDVVEQALRALPRLGRRVGGRRERPLDRGAQRVADALGAAAGSPRRARLAAVSGSSMACSLALAALDARVSSRSAAVPAHLRPSAPTAADALLCGDPARALAIAQALLVKPRMSNHHRGLWGYYGETAAGAELTVQATGIGGPSAAIVLGELAELGLRRAIRVGTCAAPGPAPPARRRRSSSSAAIAATGRARALGAAPGERGRARPRS